MTITFEEQNNPFLGNREFIIMSSFVSSLPEEVVQ
jgi:hypothetical protein